jgi:hypothetical protein
MSNQVCSYITHDDLIELMSNLMSNIQMKYSNTHLTPEMILAELNMLKYNSSVDQLKNTMLSSLIKNNNRSYFNLCSSVLVMGNISYLTYTYISSLSCIRNNKYMSVIFNDKVVKYGFRGVPAMSSMLVFGCIMNYPYIPILSDRSMIDACGYLAVFSVLCTFTTLPHILSYFIKKINHPVHSQLTEHGEFLKNLKEKSNISNVD